MNPFKSERAAKVAYTKAEKAWEAKRSEGWRARDTIRETMRTVGRMDSDEYNTLKATYERCEEEAKTLFASMRAVYEQATKQKFYVRSWHFGANPTRDLIAANMD
jgi:hypothetical protein